MPGGRRSGWVRQVRAGWDQTARAWERWESQLLYSLGAVDPVLLRELSPRPGQRVLDFGCGSGEPSLAVAQWVGPRGRVVGLDLSPAMLAVARRRARSRGIRNVRFRAGDITRYHHAGPRFHGVVSRYGLMFAEDVDAALRRCRSVLRPGGRIALAVWGPAERNASFRLTRDAIRPFLEEPEPDPETTAHPLRLARPGLLPRLLRRAGFRRVRVQAVQSPFVSPDSESYARERLECASALKAYRDLTPAQRRRVAARIRRAAARYRDGGALRIPAMAWVVSGRR